MVGSTEVAVVDCCESEPRLELAIDCDESDKMGILLAISVDEMMEEQEVASKLIGKFVAFPPDAVFGSTAVLVAEAIGSWCLLGIEVDAVEPLAITFPVPVLLALPPPFPP